MELAGSITEKCPRPDSDRVLIPKEKSAETGPLFDREDVISYSTFLNSPWPKTEAGNRPTIPAVIKRDIQAEAHEMCAICGYMNGCEIAHIIAVSESENNNTDNLIYLCPNHHTQYDFGFKVANNVTLEVVRAAKEVKQNSRRRMLKYEQNTTALLKNVVGLAKRLERTLRAEQDSGMREVQVCELKSLITQLPNLVKKAEKHAAKDEAADELTEGVLAQADRIMRSTLGIDANSEEREVLQSAGQLENIEADIELDLDEVECPHCRGAGTTGLVSNYCRLCNGRTYVSETQLDEYDASTFVEVECPHCHGRGTYGLGQDFCLFCKGDCLVDREAAEEFDSSQLDEAPCPHCHGSGTTGVNQSFCSYCRGSCVVSKEEAANYREEEIDEVVCPHCNGSGRKGNSYSYCVYCNGDCFVTKDENSEYDRNDVDEVECPRCNGSGRKGFSADDCAFCLGAGVVSREEDKSFDPEELDEIECPHCEGAGKLNFFEECPECYGAAVLSSDELIKYEERICNLVDCPHCNGSGRRGVDGESCNLCKGRKYVTEDTHSQYRAKYG